MAKNKPPSKNSRAARRELPRPSARDTSPSATDPSSNRTPHASVLAAHRSAGIQKKRKKTAQMSAKARKRHERGVEMAEAVKERTERKVGKSLGRGRVVKDRAKDWDVINRDAEAEDGGSEGEGRGEWVDEDAEDEGEAVKTEGEVVADEDGDEIL